ncbi:hypothetical protein ARTSIC4J27_546 [Pseudarthrobacter siccitolerans]|uniref:Uncharacterized protein n=1 Tax=Pseudarthrobacter siccitolerans TaxID=861266 RepID=A0A024GYQ4_9MICC|nr:hypothetical protein ARTSIC4J27_546 [Pseudarthrobacter siccitolerans]
MLGRNLHLKVPSQLRLEAGRSCRPSHFPRSPSFAVRVSGSARESCARVTETAFV